MSHQDHNKPSVFEEDIEKAYRESSIEVTSDKLDKSILAMAEKHHQAAGAQLGFFNRLFRSKQMKYLVSMSAALVMTVGIARFMVYLGKTDQGPAQNADVLLAQQESSEDFAFEMADNATEAKASRVAYQREKPQPTQVPELITNDEMRQILSESDRLAKVTKQEAELAEEQLVVVTGSRMKSADAETAAPAVVQKALADNADSELHAGVMDEAIDMSPKPEMWLQEIVTLLQKGEKKQALEEFNQFKNTYPQHPIEAKTLEKLQALGLEV